MSCDSPIYTYHFCQSSACLIDWIDHWQTMITGAAAVGAAYLAYRVSRGQLQAARDQILAQQNADIARRNARKRAVRASLPVTLSSICQYAEDTAHALADRHAVTMIEAVFPHNGEPAQMPRFPTDAIAVLERLLEFVDDEPVAGRIESIFREAQVLETRCVNLEREGYASAEFIESMILQASSLYARAESLFAYARNQSVTVEGTPLWDRALGALSIFGLRGDRWAGMLGLAHRQRERGDEPGEADERPTV